MKGKNGVRPHGFLRGAAILTAGVLVVKFLGAVFKIPLNWIIQEDGMGYFTTAYSFYSPIYSLATAGFPIAISRMVSAGIARGRFREVRQVHRVSVFLFLLTGLLGTALMLLGAGWYVEAVGNPGALPAMVLLAPSILFSCLSAIYRGYYEGLRNMTPTAVSQILEALCRLGLGLFGSFWVLQTAQEEYAALGTVFGQEASSWEQARAVALPWAAAGAVAGVTAGAAVSFLFLLLRHKLRGDGLGKESLTASPAPRKARSTAARLLKTALPIGLGAVAVNIAGLVDTTFLQGRVGEILVQRPGPLLEMYRGMIPDYNLQHMETIPNFLFGCYANAHTLFMVIPAVTQAFGVSALPNVTTAWASGNPRRLKRSMETVLRMTSLFSLPAGIGLAVLAGPLNSLLFGSGGAAPIVARVLPVMAAGAVFASMSTPLQSMLQAVGRADIPVKLLAAALLLKTFLSYWLTGIPELNIMGAAIGTLACYLFMMVGSLIALCRVTGLVPRQVFWKPLAAAALCGAAAWGCQRFLENLLPGHSVITLVSVSVAAVFYAVCLVFMGLLKSEEIARLPGGQKILKILEKRPESE